MSGRIYPASGTSAVCDGTEWPDGGCDLRYVTSMRATIRSDDIEQSSVQVEEVPDSLLSTAPRFVAPFGSEEGDETTNTL